MKDNFIKNIRDFNRFYTDFLGSLNKKILNSRFSLPEARVLFEINKIKNCTASDIVNILKIDKSYLSRILKSFYKQQLIVKKKSAADARNLYLILSDKGIAELKLLEDDVNSRIKTLYEGLTSDERSIIESSMKNIKQILEGK